MVPERYSTRRFSGQFLFSHYTRLAILVHRVINEIRNLTASTFSSSWTPLAVKSQPTKTFRSCNKTNTTYTGTKTWKWNRKRIPRHVWIGNNSYVLYLSVEVPPAICKIVVYGSSSQRRPWKLLSHEKFTLKINILLIWKRNKNTKWSVHITTQ
jgi:hypothetical protein